MGVKCVQWSVGKLQFGATVIKELNEKLYTFYLYNLLCGRNTKEKTIISDPSQASPRYPFNTQNFQVNRIILQLAVCIKHYSYWLILTVGTVLMHCCYISSF